jgi:hypothetical protein
MGFLLSILYFVSCYLSPVTVFGEFAQFRIELILAALILLVSVPKMGSFVFRTPQALALVGLALASFFSILFGMSWLGGAVNAIYFLIAGFYAYFLVALHFNSTKKLKVLVFMLLFVCLFVIANGVIDIRHGLPAEGPPVAPGTESADMNFWNYEHPYLLAMKDDMGNWTYRVRGLGEINDPNDYAQLIVCVIPLMFVFWRKKKHFRNFVSVIVPVCLLLFGLYLTKSRGALLALVAVVLVAARRRIGIVLSTILAGALFAGAMALQFTGGRAISVSAGQTRTDLWGQGLQLLKEHPLLGVGFGHMGDYSVQTAHNSIVVCAAEIGLIGLFFWSLFLFTTARDMLVIASPEKVKEAEPTEIGVIQGPFKVWKGPALDKAETNRMGFCLLLSLTGFLVAGWFLSRTYVVAFFLLGGMAEIVYEEARQQGMVALRMPLRRAVMYSAGLTICLVAMVYVMVRILNLTQ